jgi:predicted ester cyclase
MMKFFRKYKKIIYIILFLALIVLLAILIWNTFFKPSAQEPQEPITETEKSRGSLPQADEASPQTGDDLEPGELAGEDDAGDINEPEERLSDDDPSPVASGSVTKTKLSYFGRTLGATLSGDGNGVQFYDKDQGKFYRLDNNGNIYELSDQVFYEVEEISWAPNKNKAVLEYPDGSNIIYDFNKQKQVSLPKHWEDFDFSPQSDKIVAKSIGIDPYNSYLVTSNTDGSSVRSIEHIGENSDKVISDWSPNNQVAAMYTKSTDFDRQDLFFIGLNGENFKSTTVEGRDVRTNWSDKGDRLLYSAYNSNSNLQPQLWIVNAQGDSIGSGRKNLNLQTWADKCTFSDDRYVYCGVPEDLPAASGLLPDLALQTSDNLYRIDTLTGQKSLMAIPDGQYNISEPVISADGSKLYFTDQSTGEIFDINLK